MDAAEVHCSSDNVEIPPPYMALLNGEKKPEYSSRDPTMSQPHPQLDLSRFDGALCLRCNVRRAKAWYLRTQQLSPRHTGR